MENAAKKWVVISKVPQSFLLCYKDKNKNPEECTAFFCLADTEFTVLEGLGIQFRRKKGGKNIWIFYAYDKKEFDRWVKDINSVCEESMKLSEVSSSKWTMNIIEE